MADPVYSVALELVTGSFTDITDYVVQMNWTRTIGSLFTSLSPGECTIEVENQGGRFSPDNPTSAYAGLLKENVPVRLRATYSGSTYPLYYGFIDEYIVNPSLDGPRKTVMRARDHIKPLMNRTITTSLRIDVNVGSLFEEVLSASLVSSRVIDTLTEVVPFGWFRDRDARNVIKEMLDSGYYYGFTDASGVFRVRGRYYDAVGTVVSSIDEFMTFGYSRNDDSISNKVTVESVPRKQATNVATLCYISQPITIQASSHTYFWLEYLDPDNQEVAPANEMVAPVSSADYLANAVADGTGADATATTSVTATFFSQTAYNNAYNGTGNIVYLTKYQLRGKSIQRTARIAAVSEDSSSQAVYGERAYTLTNNLIGAHDFAQSYADFLIYRQKNPSANIQMSVRNVFPALLAMELGDLIHVVNTHTGVNSSESVLSLDHLVTFEPGFIHQATIGVEGYRDQGVLILDDPVFGQLDVRKLGF